MHNHTHVNCGCSGHSSNIAYFDDNSIIGVSLLSNETEFNVCSATGQHDSCFECKVLDQEGNEWTTYLGLTALHYWFNTEV